ncbi:MAG: DNA-formamidopyrimidine glycosylase family protein [Verrucomicrobiota bacterium]
MPELAEVDYYRRQWNPGLGARLTRVHCHPEKRVFRDLPQAAETLALLERRTLNASHHHGKQMLFGFTGGSWLRVHLGMTGELLVGPKGYLPEKHDHLVLYQAKRALVFRDPRLFGSLRFFRSKDVPDFWQSLPPGVLETRFDLAHHESLLARFPRSPLKGVLLKQEAYPGVGNWMADEILWQSRLHPALAAAELSPAQRNRLFQALKQVAETAMEIIAPTWGDLPDEMLFNHRWKAGGHCPRCGSELLRDTIAQRTTCWCPRCQQL